MSYPPPQGGYTLPSLGSYPQAQGGSYPPQLGYPAQQVGLPMQSGGYYPVTSAGAFSMPAQQGHHLSHDGFGGGHQSYGYPALTSQPNHFPVQQQQQQHQHTAYPTPESQSDGNRYSIMGAYQPPISLNMGVTNTEFNPSFPLSGPHQDDAAAYSGMPSLYHQVGLTSPYQNVSHQVMPHPGSQPPGNPPGMMTHPGNPTGNPQGMRYVSGGGQYPDLHNQQFQPGLYDTGPPPGYLPASRF